MKTIQDFNFKNQKALIRVDFNVPLNENFEVTDTTRIEAAKSSIIKVLEDGGSVILMSHLGRPKGVEEKYSLKHIVEKVSEVIGVQVKFVDKVLPQDDRDGSKNLIKLGKVDFLVRGDDAVLSKEVKTILSLGGQFVHLKRTPEISTTEIINKIKKT